MTEILTHDDIVAHYTKEDQHWLAWKDTSDALFEILKTPRLGTAPSKRGKHVILKPKTGFNGATKIFKIKDVNTELEKLITDHKIVSIKGDTIECVAI